MENSDTWADFKAALPPSEFEELTLWWSTEGNYIYQEGDAFPGSTAEEVAEFRKVLGSEAADYIIRADDNFDADRVPGFVEMDYPPWLACTAINELPKEFVNKHGIPVTSMLSGSWYEFPSDNIEEMKAELEAHGFKVLLHLSDDWNDAVA